jgi:mono/diheme cytochrome c family protein
MFWIALFLVQVTVTPQIERGEALFFDATKGCASCHSLKGRGTAVGPDLMVMGRLSPAAIAMATRSTVTQYVQIVKLKARESFPGMPGVKDEKTIRVYDLSKTPPELLTIERTEVESMTGNDRWKHPPVTRKYTDEQMADLVAYIRYAVTGSRKSVDPSEVH